MKDTLKFSLTLFAICALAGLLLSVVYAVTEPKISQQKKQREEEAIAEVLPIAERIETAQKDELTYYVAKDKRNRLIGYIFISQIQGYASEIKIAAAISPLGEIIRVKILEQNETPGVGSQITEETFLRNFSRRKTESLNDHDAISGATISSSAVIKVIKDTALKILER